ncbi:aspartate aminotransferase family protein [Paenibacillus sp. GD4]|uniref:pyridoxal phosphate-dependent decarboxylase family protein n=1 Tax=Paenibacillus sp. GD4 TaxID=3068890 RepID=UPI002796D8FC|nr:aspartate aminotransferase family protein [Paenibacillus sp. GD4]MDQ1914171.1 aspartate aminotransferase family protein [Paenibacillus sp. GD4]
MNRDFAAHFVTPNETSQASYRRHMNDATNILLSHFAGSARPYSGLSPQELAVRLREHPVCPEEGVPLPEVLQFIGEQVLEHSAVVTHPACMAHLHCPPLQSALAAEVLISAANASMDSWDQSMSATILEQDVIRWLAGMMGLAKGDGVFTGGGTQSNLMGLLLARDHYAYTRWGWRIQQKGLPAEAGRMRVLCSDSAHFTVKQSAALLGLGHESVVHIPTDEAGRMQPKLLEQTVVRLKSEGFLPFALVATAGTTDLGGIDPLTELAEIAQREGLWLHTDAAYGGALMLSGNHAAKLTGIERSDSITIDFHKMFYQPISCGAFLVKDKTHYRYIRMKADYLNPQQDEEAGVPNLVDHSIQTTRRFDALKLYTTLRHHGRAGLAAMIDHNVLLARQTAQLIRQEPRLELLAEPAISTVVFRFVSDSCHDQDGVQERIRSRLLREGLAVVARTRVRGKAWLKLTLINPLAELQDTGEVLQQIVRIGTMLESESQGTIGNVPYHIGR